ncbi:MAG: gamma-glutamyl-gamma-aminobutyrate hydrolase family protein [Chloroflexota bacterium]
MARTPFIGITTYHRNEEGIVRLPGEYADSVRRAGGIPLLLQPGEPRMDEVIGLIDGLILSGGGDVDPARYSEATHEQIYSVNQERDDFEFDLLDRVLGTQLPTLCICRGLQVLNVALSGTLIPHIPDAIPDCLAHRQPPDKPYGPIIHPVQVEDSSRLAAIMQSGTVKPASWHHQAIDKLASDLTVISQASDGIIEAVEMPAHSQLIAVQWHPEITAAEDETQQRIFNELVRMAGKE